MKAVTTLKAPVTVESVGVERVCASPFQRRRHFPEEEEKELAQSIEAHGVIQPLVMRPVSKRAVQSREQLLGEVGDVLEIVAGERRWRAAKRAGLQEVPAIVRVMEDAEAAQICLIENLQRKGLTLIEEARSLDDLVGLGMTLEEVARQIGKDRSYVTRRRRLLRLPEGAQEALERGELSLVTAQRLAKLPPEVQPEALERLQKRGLGRGDLPQRAALDVLQREFVEPLEVAAMYEGEREEVVRAYAEKGVEVEWCDYKEACRRGSWVGGLVGGNALVRSASDGLTWGELAERFEAKPLLAVEHSPWMWEAGDEVSEGDGQVVREPFIFSLVYEKGPLEAAERWRAENAGEPCVFGSGGGGDDDEEEKVAAAEKAAEARAEAEAVRKEAARFLKALVGGEMSIKKERELCAAVWGWRTLEDYMDFDELFTALGWLPEEGDDEDRWARVDVKVLARMRKADGGFAATGMLLVGVVVLDVLRYHLGGAGRQQMAELARLKMFPARDYPRLHARGVAAAAAEEEAVSSKQQDI